MTEVLSIEHTKIHNVTMTAHCRDCASQSDQHETQVNVRSLHVRCEPRANSGNTLIIIIIEICKAPTLRLKALNKHAHIMYIEMENVIKKIIIIKMYISTSVQA